MNAADSIVPTAVIRWAEKSQASNMQWYQPLFAENYSGLRRYGAGDQVQAWVFQDGVATKSGEAVTLMGSERLTVAAMVISSLILSI